MRNVKGRDPLRDVLPPHTLCKMPADTPILLGFSGGADSSALLSLLLEMKKLYGFSLTAAHLDHGIRGEEAARDLAFCRRMAEERGVELIVGHADVPALAIKHSLSLEEAARDARYAFFEDVMRERDIPILVTAHHATDNLETLLFRLMRGTGSHGMYGIRPVRPFANGFLVRPMLGVSARDVRAYCDRCYIPFVTDSTNGDLSITRNRIRHEVLPPMLDAYPGMEARVSRLCLELREDGECLDALGDALLDGCRTEKGLSLSRLRHSPRPVLRRALRAWLAACGVTSLMHAHEDALLRLVASGSEVDTVRVGKGITVRVTGDLLTADRPQAPCKPPSFDLPLEPGVTRVSGTGFTAVVTRLEGGIKVHNLSTDPYIILSGEFDIIKQGAVWRERREGDVILLRSMHRKLRKLQNEAGIPQSKRRTLPLLCDGDGILWAPLIGVRDGIPVRSEKDAQDGDLLICLMDENT